MRDVGEAVALCFVLWYVATAVAVLLTHRNTRRRTLEEVAKAFDRSGNARLARAIRDLK